MIIHLRRMFAWCTARQLACFISLASVVLWSHADTVTDTQEHFLSDGAFYTGTLVNQLPHGLGTKVYDDGRRYSGHFMQGVKQGIGVMIWPSGDRYEGEWRNDQATGTGVLRFASGGLYRGDFQHGLPHGQGRFEYANGDLYEGHWHQGIKQGKGKITYALGGYYEGTFYNGQRHGDGLLVTGMGDRYQGPFRNDQRQGTGLCGHTSRALPCRFEQDIPVTEAPLPSAQITVESLELDIITLPQLPELNLTATQLSSRPPAGNENSVANQFGQQIHQALATLNPTPTLSQLDADISEIRFTHDMPNVDLKRRPARIDWRKQRALLGGRLYIHVDLGVASLSINMPYKGPGEYSMKPDWLSFQEADSSFFCQQEADCIVTIIDDQTSHLSGTFTLTLQQKNRRYPEQRRLENGVFRLLPARRP